MNRELPGIIQIDTVLCADDSSSGPFDREFFLADVRQVTFIIYARTTNHAVHRVS